MKRSTSLIELRDASSEDSSGMRRPRSHQDLQALGRQSGASTPNTPIGGHAKVPMLSEKELREHFNMPLNEVAKKFGMCTTALKKLCRKYGVMQWPHRKLRSLEKKIASLRAEQRYTTDGHGNLDEEIRKFELQREALVTGNGEPGDDDRAWSPGIPGSPGGYDDGGEFGGSFAAAQETKSGRSLQGQPAMWGGDGGGDKLAEKHSHLQKLEDENNNLRALSRSLMKEREDLVNSLNATSSEMEQLRTLCSSLTTQLNMLNVPINGDAATRASIKAEPVYEQQPTSTGHTPTHHTGPTQSNDMHRGWANASGDDKHNQMDQSPQMHPSTWAQQGGGELHHPPAMTTAAPAADESMAALSWMAPDFDLDDLL